jgi:hypothetical protein
MPPPNPTVLQFNVILCWGVRTTAAPGGPLSREGMVPTIDYQARGDAPDSRQARRWVGNGAPDRAGDAWLIEIADAVQGSLEGLIMPTSVHCDHQSFSR